MNTCKTCRFWADVDEEVSGLGNCHRFPPTAHVVVIEGLAHNLRPQDGGYPLTFEEDWCGEWLPCVENIEQLGLSVRSQNVLSYAGIRDIASLVAMTEKDVGCLRNCGITSLNEIKSKLHKHGLSLRYSSPPSPGEQA